MPYVAFDYLYRDASNYKAFGSVYLQGSLTNEDIRALQACLIDDEFFVAQAIPIPALDSQLFDLSCGPNDDDHQWHTFEAFRELDHLTPGMEIWGSVEAFLAAFAQFREKLHPALAA